MGPSPLCTRPGADGVGVVPSPRSVLRPAGFHGTSQLRRHARGKPPRGSYFEGWYVKLVSADRATRMAVIPGVFVSEDGSVAESFVQVLDGMTGATAYHRFPLEAFHADEHRFDVRVGDNRFDARGMTLQLPGLAADVRFGELTPWPVTLREPGAMGWYAWVPTMECYHGVLSLDHGLDGWIETPAGRVHLAGGLGYLEKDWGTAFPSAYVWLQSNHFEQQGVSLVASTALIPWRRSAFRGDLVGLRLPSGPARGLHRFTSYTRARTELLDVARDVVAWRLVAADGTTLAMHASVTGRATGLLHAPVRTQMHQRVAETLDGNVQVTLTGPGGESLFDGTGQCAGVEVHGAIASLLATPGRQSSRRPSVVRTRSGPERQTGSTPGRDPAPHTNRRKHGQG